jgi:hypothetical protein
MGVGVLAADGPEADGRDWSRDGADPFSCR